MVTNTSYQPTSKDERTLLMFAAKAAGMVGYRYVTPDVEHRLLTDRGVAVWNPLKDDGDALKLAVKLRITVEQELLEVKACAYVLIGVERKYFTSVSGNVSREAATRLAIVRAAAEIGKAMK